MEGCGNGGTRENEEANSSRQESGMEGEVQESGCVAALPTTAELEQLIEKQQGRCALSGRMIGPRKAALDHKHPVSRGGTHALTNLQWLDPVVNKAKHMLTNDEFVELCKQVALNNQ